MPDYLRKFGLLLGLMCGLPLLHALISAPRAWAADETPVAFWAWRKQAPTPAEVEQAARQTRATRLFLRAGQLDYERGQLRRIRAVEGKLPDAIETHLVYNATRDLLSGFEKIEPAALAQLIADTFTADFDRARRDGANVTGLQLDIDVPTRLLPRYSATLRLLRGILGAPLLKGAPRGIKLSITGLPTWMDSPQIDELLAEVDFWIPQCYGAAIPDRADKLIPISSPFAVRQAVIKARELNRPFYVGLSAYGYVALYSPEGALIEVRGDLATSLIVNNPQFELQESRPFDDSGYAEWRGVYRVLSDSVIDGLVVRRGDLLMLNTPSTATLRANARAARQEAGSRLLGICVFRLPGVDDPTNLTIAEIGAALADRDTTVATELKIEQVGDVHSGDPHRLVVTATNTGTANARPGDGALTIELPVSPGGLNDLSGVSGFAGYETLCQGPGADAPRLCSMRRANLLRLKTHSWPPGARARIGINFASAIPAKISARIRIRTDDGHEWRMDREITFNKEPGS